MNPEDYSEKTVSLITIEKIVYKVLKEWHGTDFDDVSFDYLFLFRQIQAEDDKPPREIMRKIIFDALDTLAISDREEAQLLSRRFFDEEHMRLIANSLNMSYATAYRKQREAIDHLSLIVLDKEIQARNEYLAALENRLNLPPEIQLIGREEYLDRLINLLTLPDLPWIVSIEGLGGIGKTSLANKVVREIGSTVFRAVAWIECRPQNFTLTFGVTIREHQEPCEVASVVSSILEQLGNTSSNFQSLPERIVALSLVLKKVSHLVVIDGFETVLEPEALLPLLRRLANPSKFLLTSRHKLFSYPYIFSLSLEELSPADSIRLIKHEATTRGLSSVLDASETELFAIYEVVGGNPLVLKLVVGQLTIFPLDQVLEQLRRSKGKTVEELYTYIYHQSYLVLSENSKKVLHILPLASGGTIDQLQNLSRLDIDELIQALEQLINLSLVEVTGDLSERRYHVHRLTETFLANSNFLW